ncbi:MAG TPA: glycosyltransferase family A protein [Anaerolineae bacterium]|nr:glycosyltransferase family A protein [Anaerolineae bacterium]HQK13164.1 glycosyltransferase family A protein [Anaerolineae bacterium]
MINQCIQPVVSVIMPVYNAMPYLPLAVESILQQTFTDFEFIILDDGSTDTGATYLRALNDARVVLLQDNENQGYTRRLNQGIALARGKYLARQDADDVSLPERFARQVAQLDKNTELAALFSAYETIDENGNTLSRQHPPIGFSALRQALFYTNPLSHGSAMMRRECLQAVGGYNTAFEPAEDYELWLRLANAYSIDAIADVLYQMRVYTASVTGKRRVEQRRMATKACTEAFARCDPAMLSPRTVALHHFAVALHLISEGDVSEGQVRLQRMIQADPALTANDLIPAAVNLAVELGPSGRAFLQNSRDEYVARQFLALFLECLPENSYTGLRSDLFAEYHAACAFLYHKQKRLWKTTYHVLQSWISGPRHRRNRGLVKLILRSI